MAAATKRTIGISRHQFMQCPNETNQVRAFAAGDGVNLIGHVLSGRSCIKVASACSARRGHVRRGLDCGRLGSTD